MKRWWIAVFVAGLSITAPAFAHDHDDRAAGGGDRRADRAPSGGYAELDHHGRDDRHDDRRTYRELRRDQARRYFEARARAKHRMYHQARARAHAAEARYEAGRAYAEGARARRW
jgi:hypothetical protein